MGYYTGTPQINIPLYTIEEANISLPISLSYHASGIKVEEVASWVGLGWSLNAGGVISRTMIGKEDELNIGSNSDYRTIGVPNPNISLNSFQNFVVKGEDDDADEIKQIVDGTYDLEPDIFHYNFAGYSGKFVIEPFASTESKIEVVTIPVNPALKIEAEIKNTIIDKWIITDDKGFVYTFGGTNAKETTTTHSFDPHGTPGNTNGEINYTSGWFLTSISSPYSSEDITFTYTDDRIVYDQKKSEIKYASLTPSSDCGTMEPKNTWTNTEADTKKLESIFFSKGAIHFHKTQEGRKDLAERFWLCL
ncbi:MAG: hypothetical protein HC831_25075, partial [Chloroflexia bacterium]|nr:hypothetical protein [Chloroflexia bacterium]